MPVIETANGAAWGYGRFGRAGGKPVLVHHGLIGDATLDPAWQALGDAFGIEWIVIERPGYGQTPVVAMARVADWAGMMVPLLDALGLTGAFDAVGLSAGAPYAYALAAGLPDRVQQVCILSGVPFIGASGVLAAYPEEAQNAYARYATSDEAALRAEFRAFCTAVVAQIGNNARLSNALAAIMAADVAGPAREARLQARDWGFERGAVTCPVDLWHAEADEMVPFAAARLSARPIKRNLAHPDRAVALPQRSQPAGHGHAIGAIAAIDPHRPFAQDSRGSLRPAVGQGAARERASGHRVNSAAAVTSPNLFCCHIRRVASIRRAGLLVILLEQRANARHSRSTTNQRS